MSLSKTCLVKLFGLIILIVFTLYVILIMHNTAFWSNPVTVSGEYTIDRKSLGSQPDIQFQSNNNNFDKMGLRAINIEQDYNECKEILAIYDNKTIEWPELDSKFESRGFRFGNPQSMQDWFLFSAIFRPMYNSAKRGIYLDLAANTPKRYSNTWFFDKCLSWTGVCVEAQPTLIEDLRKMRNCEIVDKCVWSEPKNLTFVSSNKTACAGLKNYNRIENCRGKMKESPMQCTTLSQIISDSGLTHIDYLSLDIEGAETRALMGTDFNRVHIDVFTVEVNSDQYSNDSSDDVFQILTDNGFIPKFHLPRRDVVFVHRNATDKIAAIDNWIATVPWQNTVVHKDASKMFGTFNFK